MTEYELVGLNRTVQMKQNWWHAHEAGAGPSGGQPAPTWEAAFVVADFLTRHKDPWMSTPIATLRPPMPEVWDWRDAVVAVLGVEIGLTATATGLSGARVLGVDASIRMLEAAKANAKGNMGDDGGRVVFRKALWGAPLGLDRLTGGVKHAADVVVISHADCEAIAGQSLILKSALSVSAPHTLLLLSFLGNPCSGIKALSAQFEMGIVDAKELVPDLADQVTVVAMKRKPEAAGSEEDA